MIHGNDVKKCFAWFMVLLLTIVWLNGINKCQRVFVITRGLAWLETIDIPDYNWKYLVYPFGIHQNS